MEQGDSQRGADESQPAMELVTSAVSWARSGSHSSPSRGGHYTAAEPLLAGSGAGEMSGSEQHGDSRHGGVGLEAPSAPHLKSAQGTPRSMFD